MHVLVVVYHEYSMNAQRTMHARCMDPVHAGLLQEKSAALAATPTAPPRVWPSEAHNTHI